MVISQGVSYTFSTHVPDWFTASRGIYEYELAGTLFGLLCAMEIAYGAPVLLLCGNMGAKGTVIRGSSKKRTARAIAWGILGVFRRCRGSSMG